MLTICLLIPMNQAFVKLKTVVTIEYNLNLGADITDD